MTTQTEVGISPVLLQAITQQLADPNAGPEKVTQVKTFCDENGQQKIVLCRSEGEVILKQEQNLNVMEANNGQAGTLIMTEAVDGAEEAMRSGRVIKTEHLVDETTGELVVEEGMRHVIMGQPIQVGDNNSTNDFVVVSQESETGYDDGQFVVVRNVNAPKERVISTTSDGRFTIAQPGSVSDGRFTIAQPSSLRRHLSESHVDENDQKIYIRVPQGVSRAVMDQPLEMPATTSSPSEMSMGSVLSAIASHHARLKQDAVAASTSVEAATLQSDEGENSQQIIIYTQEMPVAGSDIAVANSEVIISDSGQCDMPPAMKRQCMEGQHLLLINDSAETMNCVQGDMIPYSDKGGPSPWTNYVQQFSAKGPCPICGDKVSGYHYGIYCCESCKGFFKRTVQNNKSFACHRKDDCDVLIASRKKCPACRFRKCVMMGMKVGAVRGDRARGGRSVYDGCSPHLKRKLSYQEKQQASSSKEKLISEAVPVAVSETTVVASQSGEMPSISSPLVAILNSSKSTESEMTDVIKPMVPQTVMEIMNLESILCEEEEDQTFQAEDENFYTSLLQIADQRLYKIVRWARSLPDFAIISTDDQILLLQSAWADLLCLDCCWRSLQTPNEIKLSYCKSINLDVAREIGAEEIVDRMLQLTQHLHRIQLDMSEFACLKVLILMTPDVKGLKDISHIRNYQEKVTDALMVFSTTHYPHHANKFGELLLRLPEIAKTSCIGKEMLGKKDLPAEISSFSLLMELLKTNPPAT